MEILKGKVLLIVEDEADLREPLAMEFESLGCRVFQAKNGQEGFAIVQREKIDAVISDIRMPGGDGVELLKNIKNLSHDFPVVMLITGFSDLPREDAYDLGAEAILAKPFDLDEIDAAVCRILTPRAERWKRDAPPAALDNQIEHTFLDLDSTPNEISIGRGGMFIQTDSLPSMGKSVHFNLRFKSGDLRVIEGSGFVRWARAKSSDILNSGCGIEFESLCENTREKVIQITDANKTKAFIPKGSVQA